MASTADPPSEQRAPSPVDTAPANTSRTISAKPRPSRYAYHHSNADITVHELEEFFSYVEVSPVVTDCKLAWQSANFDWFAASESARHAIIVTTFDLLEHPDMNVRHDAARRLSYIALGIPLHSPDEPSVHSTESHLCTISKNCALLRDCGAFYALFTALRNAGRHWSYLSSADSKTGGPPPERKELLDDLNNEISTYLCCLYFMIETLRGDQTLADELMSLDPPMPIYLFTIVAGLREVNVKGYPVKKLLLLLWKSFLACFGESKDLKRVKALVREIEGFHDDDTKYDHKESFETKASIVDLHNFVKETSSKYPTFNPPIYESPIPSIPVERIITAASPAPIRPYPYRVSTHHKSTDSFSDKQQNGSNGNQMNGGGGGAQPPQASTPAPSPPSSPSVKMKKAHFQTDQKRPYVMPFSRANASATNSDLSAVPRAINEAAQLFKQNVMLSTELWQMWKVREELLEDETGVRTVNNNLQNLVLSDDNHFRNTAVMMHNDPSNAHQEQSERDSHKMLQQLELEILQQARDPSLDAKERNRLLTKANDVKRLQRVELFYRGTLPHLHSAIVVLLKLMLATVAANNNNVHNPEHDSVQEDNISHASTLEGIDIMRHREITSKAVSAILILCLRWFKASHAMKFHFFSQLLVDSNCLLLILKIFGLHEISTMVKTKNDVEEYNFFNWCSLVLAGKTGPSPETYVKLGNEPSSDSIAESPEALGPIDVSTNNDVDLIYDYSWRTFFSTINFVHILQKLTKRRVQRILLLVQYKTAAILKRILRVSHPLLQLYVLKVIKSQIPYAGRKWRQSNMKVITAIYLNCKPGLRDDWLTYTDADNDVEESVPNEQNLRLLIRFYNSKHYGQQASNLHRRSSSAVSSSGRRMSGLGSMDNGSDTILSPTGMMFDNRGGSGSNMSRGAVQDGLAAAGPPGGPGGGQQLTASNLPPTFEENTCSTSFPPARSVSTFGADRHLRTSYIPDSFMEGGYLENYEEYLGDIFTSSQYLPNWNNDQESSSPTTSPRIYGISKNAWDRLGDVLGPNFDASDSESVASIGYLDVSSSSDGGSSSSVSGGSDDGGEGEGEVSGDVDDEMIMSINSRSINSINSIVGNNQEDEEEEEEENGKTDWEHLSPKTMTALEEERAAQRGIPGSPLSPRPRRRSSTDTSRSPALRPVIPLNFDSQGDDDDDGYDQHENSGSNDNDKNGGRRSSFGGRRSSFGGRRNSAGGRRNSVGGRRNSVGHRIGEEHSISGQQDTDQDENEDDDMILDLGPLPAHHVGPAVDEVEAIFGS